MLLSSSYTEAGAFSLNIENIGNQLIWLYPK